MNSDVQAYIDELHRLNSNVVVEGTAGGKYVKLNLLENQLNDILKKLLGIKANDAKKLFLRTLLGGPRVDIEAYLSAVENATNILGNKTLLTLIKEYVGYEEYSHLFNMAKIRLKYVYAKDLLPSDASIYDIQFQAMYETYQNMWEIERQKLVARLENTKLLMQEKQDAFDTASRKIVQLEVETQKTVHEAAQFQNTINEQLLASVKEGEETRYALQRDVEMQADALSHVEKNKGSIEKSKLDVEFKQAELVQMKKTAVLLNKHLEDRIVQQQSYLKQLRGVDRQLQDKLYSHALPGKHMDEDDYVWKKDAETLVSYLNTLFNTYEERLFVALSHHSEAILTQSIEQMRKKLTHNMAQMSFNLHAKLDIMIKRIQELNDEIKDHSAIYGKPECTPIMLTGRNKNALRCWEHGCEKRTLKKAFDSKDQTDFEGCVTVVCVCEAHKNELEFIPEIKIVSYNMVRDKNTNQSVWIVKVKNG